MSRSNGLCFVPVVVLTVFNGILLHLDCRWWSQTDLPSADIHSTNHASSGGPTVRTGANGVWCALPKYPGTSKHLGHRAPAPLRPRASQGSVRAASGPPR